MTQLASDTDAAVGGDSVADDTAPDATEQAAPTEERFVETESPDNSEQPDEMAEMYPDDQRDENAADGVDEEDEDFSDEADEPDEPAIDPPHSWKAEEKERWNEIPRATQEYLSQRETERERFVQSKAQEAAQAKADVDREYADQFAQFKEQQAQQYKALASQFYPQEPDEGLLHTGNPQDHLTYQQQEAAYRRGLAQQRQLQQRSEQEAGEAQQIREEQERQAMQTEAQRLREAMPEWFDPQERTKLQGDLGAIATDLGYPPELLAEANASDLLALRKASEWKADAEKWRVHDKSRRNPNGTYKAKRAIPPSNKPGTSQVHRQQSNDPVKLLYPND